MDRPDTPPRSASPRSAFPRSGPPRSGPPLSGPPRPLAAGSPRLTPLLPPPAPRQPADFSLATVNIVLLLVLFFLVAGAPSSQSERSLQLPETRTLPLDALPRPLLLVQDDGAMELDGTSIDSSSLMQQVAEGALPRLHLVVARDFPAQRLVALSQTLSGAGVSVFLLTLRLPEAEAGP